MVGDVERAELERRLATATSRALALTRSLVFDAIPDAVCFALHIQKWDVPVPLAAGEVVFAEDPQRFPEAPRRQYTAAQLVDALWREGRAPRWIDLVVIAVEDGRAVIRADASARFTADPAVFDDRLEPGRPFVVKAVGPPPWIAMTPHRIPRERYGLTWQVDPAGARRAYAAEAVGTSPRRMQLRRRLAGPRTAEAFQELLGLIRARPGEDLPWRDEAEVAEAIAEAEQGLAAWDDATRVGGLAALFFGDGRVRPWSQLLRHLEVARVEGAHLWAAAMNSPWLARLVGLEVRRSSVDFQSLARSTHVCGLRRLVVHDAAITDDEEAALVGSKNLAGLTHLTLSSLHLPPGRLAAWLDGAPGRSVRELVLRGLARAEHIEVLLARPRQLARLEHLGLCDGWLRDPEALRLASCAALGHLRVLDLRSRELPHGISPTAAAVLRASPQLARAEILLGARG